MHKILKDITICYDGIHPIELKKGEMLDIKALLPDPEKADKFHARLIGLSVVGTEPVKTDKEADAKETESQEEPKEEAAKEADAFSDMKKKELQKFLDDAGIEYESDANKPRLIELARSA